MLIPGAHSPYTSWLGAPEPALLWSPHWGLRLVDTGRAPGGAAPGENSKCLGRNP